MYFPSDKVINNAKHINVDFDRPENGLTITLIRTEPNKRTILQERTGILQERKLVINVYVY